MSFGLEFFLEDDLVFLVGAASTIALVSGLDSTSLEDSNGFFLSITSYGNFLLVWRQLIYSLTIVSNTNNESTLDLILNGSC